MQIRDIPKGTLVVVRWKDILWAEQHVRDEDIERTSPMFETVGKWVGAKRGLVVIKPEWGLMTDYEEYEGEAGQTSQIMPAGCIEAIYECKIGKRIYKSPPIKDEVSTVKDGTSLAGTSGERDETKPTPGR